ncbi:transcriptional regulatory protein GAL4 [Microdochium nivale]|nr:transcriptional regulatory protein GAL4 [Microdochium nivale]
MFHRFDSRLPKDAPPPAPARLNKSCSECSRRRVKCDGKQPCGSCAYYKVTNNCNYRVRTKRHAVSRSTLEEVTERLKLREEILERLFPDLDLDSLTDTSREDLLAALSGANLPVQCKGTPTDDSTASVSGSRADLDELTEAADDGDHGFDEATGQLATLRLGNDNNALDLAIVQRPRSYMGVTSISAILRAIFRLCPWAKQYVSDRVRSLYDPTGADFRPQMVPVSLGSSPNPSEDLNQQQVCLHFYFMHVHPVTPMLDEGDFRHCYQTGMRQDPAWLGLVNMVLTLGSIAAGNDVLHDHFYELAKTSLDLEIFGAGNLESVQALSLLGGYYLHYRNSPNTAYALLGAAHRLAIGLGLHREPRKSAQSQGLSPSATSSGTATSRNDSGRRTWWSLLCLDTWATMTLGRPVRGRWDDETMDVKLPEPATPDDYDGMSLRASSEFCLIANRVQHRLAQNTRITREEATAFDQEVQKWHADLPAALTSFEEPIPRLSLAREYMRNRYYNLRLVPLRSLLLYLVQDQSVGKPMRLADQELIKECREVAAEAINSIALYWTRSLVHCWNTSWYLFQAGLVPLLSIAVENLAPGDDPKSSALGRTSLATAVSTFVEMRQWIRPIDKTPEIITALAEAVTTQLDGGHQQVATYPIEGDSGYFRWYDEQLSIGNELDWSYSLLDSDQYLQTADAADRAKPPLIP